MSGTLLCAVRIIIIGAAALALSLMALASPAGASTSHSKYLHWVHEYVPGTKHVPNKKLVAFGEKTCDYLRPGRSVATVAKDMLAFDHKSGYRFTVDEVGELFAAAVTDFCPSFVPALDSYDNQYGPIGSKTTTSTTLPEYAGRESCLANMDCPTPSDWTETQTGADITSYALQQVTTLSQYTPFNIGAVALLACSNLDQGNTPQQTLANMQQNSALASYDAQAIYTAAIADLCPQYIQDPGNPGAVYNPLNNDSDNHDVVPPYGSGDGYDSTCTYQDGVFIPSESAPGCVGPNGEQGTAVPPPVPTPSGPLAAPGYPCTYADEAYVSGEGCVVNDYNYATGTSGSTAASH